MPINAFQEKYILHNVYCFIALLVKFLINSFCLSLNDDAKIGYSSSFIFDIKFSKQVRNKVDTQFTSYASNEASGLHE